jgi:hypothetical protein
MQECGRIRVAANPDDGMARAGIQAARSRRTGCQYPFLPHIVVAERNVPASSVTALKILLLYPYAEDIESRFFTAHTGRAVQSGSWDQAGNSAAGSVYICEAIN